MPGDSSLSVRLQSVSFAYGAIDALAGVTLDLSGPGVVAVVGPNGAGKTTLMRLLATVIRPQTGTISSGGLQLSHRDAVRDWRRHLGYVPQHGAFPANVTVEDFVRYVAWLKEIERVQLERSIDSVFAALELDVARSQKVRKLSGGFEKRVSIAQSLVNDPAVLLLDEPTAGLDPVQRIQFRDVVRQKGQGALVILSTHILDDVADLGEQIVVINRGAVLFNGSRSDLIDLGRAAQTGPLANRIGRDDLDPLERGYLAALGDASQTPSNSDRREGPASRWRRRRS